MSKPPQKNNLIPKKIKEKLSVLTKFLNKRKQESTSENYSEMVENFRGKIKNLK